MQIFKVVELKEYPYFHSIEINIGETIKDIINNDNNEENVFLLLDHDSKRIWTYNGPKSAFKHQVYGSILAGMIRRVLKMFYRVFLLNKLSKESKEFEDIVNKPLSGGRARAIEISDFPKYDPEKVHEPYIKIDTNIRVNKAIEDLYELAPPDPEIFLRRLLIIGGNIYSEEETPESFIQKEKSVIKPVKLGQLNNGFTFFDDHYYSTRLIIKDQKVQTIELFIRKEDKSPSLELQIPIIPEENFSNVGNLVDLIDSFKIPDQLPEKSENQG